MADEIFQFTEWAKSQGLSLLDLDPMGNPKVKTPDGKEETLDINEIVISEGGDPKNIEIEYNTPKNPLNTSSPVSPEVRYRLSFGETKGNLAYLKSQFEDAAYDPDEGLSIKRGGAWHAVDPSLLGKGNAWDKTKEIVKHGFGLINNPDLAGDLAELGPEALNAALSTAGAVAGTYVAGPVGSIAGAGAGGALSGKIRTSLGRMIGTYQATDEEQIRDIMLEAAITMGSQGIALGAKPAVGLVGKGLQGFWNKASDSVKSAYAQVFGRYTGTGVQAAETLFDEAIPVMKKSAEAVAATKGKTGTAIEYAAAKKLETLGQLADESSSALTTQYGKHLDELISSSDNSGLKVDFQEIGARVFNKVEELGVGKLDDAGSFQFFGPKGVAERSLQGMESELLTPEESRILKPLLTSIKAYADAGGKKTDKAAAIALTSFEKNFNKIKRVAFEKGSSNLQRIVGEIGSEFKNGVSDAFHSAGLGTKYLEKAKLYSEYGTMVDEARRLIKNRDFRALETFANQVMSTHGAKVAAKTNLESMESILGQRGKDLLRDFRLWHAAEKFTPWMTSNPLIISAISAGGTAAATTGNVVPIGVAAAVSGASSPKLNMAAMALRQGATKPFSEATRIAFKGLDLLKSLTPDEVKALITNDQAFAAWLRPMIQYEAEKSGITERLLQYNPMEDNGQRQQ